MRSKAAEVVGQDLQVARFHLVVELAHQRLAELLQHLDEAEAPAHLGVEVGEGGDLAQRLQVLDDLLADARALHLDRDLAPVAQRRAVHLAQGGRRHRLRLELGEGLGEPDAQLGAHDALDLQERERPHLVLQAGQRLHVGQGQQIGARGQELADLDEGRPHLLEVGGEMLGQLGFAERRDQLGGGDVLEAGVLHQIGPPVLHEKRDARRLGARSSGEGWRRVHSVTASAS